MSTCQENYWEQTPDLPWPLNVCTATTKYYTTVLTGVWTLTWNSRGLLPPRNTSIHPLFKFDLLFSHSLFSKEALIREKHLWQTLNPFIKEVAMHLFPTFIRHRHLHFFKPQPKEIMPTCISKVRGGEGRVNYVKTYRYNRFPSN